MSRPLIVAAIALAYSSMVFAQEGAGVTTMALELKGQRLGTALSDVLTNTPGAACEEKRPGLTLCILQNTTLGSYPAELWLNYLDGTLIRIDYRRIDYKDALAIDEGLRAKYGEPQVGYVNGQLKDGSYRSHPVSMWHNGDEVLMRTPIDMKDRKTEDVWSEVSLSNSQKWKNGWQVRLKAKPVSPETAADL